MQFKLTNNNAPWLVAVLVIIDLLLLYVFVAIGQTIDGDPYEGVAQLQNRDVYYRCDTTFCRIGDTLSVQWDSPDDIDLSGYYLNLFNGTINQAQWIPIEGVSTGQTIWTAPRRIIAPAGLYYVGLEAQDISGNKSPLSVCVFLDVKSTLPRRPKMVRIFING
jgi:hypothetical protein